MCGGGKSGQSTQSQYGSVSGNPQAIGMADTAWGKASTAANLPFQEYGGEFVAPINQQQTTGIEGINQGAGTYAPYAQAALNPLQPYFGAATGTLNQGLSAGQALTGAGAGLTAANASLDPMAINRWMNPYIQNVVGATERQQQQQNAIQQSQLEGSAIQSGAFGGDRSGVAAANLAYQQNLANQPVIANLYNQGFSQALGEANTQQQAGLSAGAQFGALGNQFFNQGLAGSQQYAGLGQGLSGAYAGLGTTAQQNALTGAQAQLGAGTLEQQTQQARDTALYNQFLQKQAYPFQTSQFLTNTVQGLAPIYGTQTNTTGTSAQPISFFKRGGAVHDLEMDDNGEYRLRKAGGGGLSDDALSQLIAAHGQMYAPRVPAADQGPYGTGLSSRPTQLPTVNLPSMGGQRYDTGIGHSMDTLNRGVEFGKNLGDLYTLGKKAAVGSPASTVNGKTTPATGGIFGRGGVWGDSATTTAPPPSASAPAQTFAYTNADGQLVDAAGNIISSRARGGRTGMAHGGLPYESGISDAYLPRDLVDPLNPLETMQNRGGLSMPTMGGGGQQSSGLGSALGTATKLASMVIPFLADGGRIGKDEGGGLSATPTPSAPADVDPAVLDRSRHVIGKLESTHDYGIIGKPTKMPNGVEDRPHGAYQVMGSNVGPWTKEVLGREMTPDEFRASPEAQDKVFNAKFGQYIKQTGSPAEAAAMWFSGRPLAQSANDKDVLGTKVSDYVNRFKKEFGMVPTGQASGSANANLATLGGPTPANPPDKQSWWDRESGGLSGTERGVISLLSGLGGMASSPSRYFGGALLSGLGAGANTYGALAQKGKALDIQQQQANTAVGRLGVEGVKSTLELQTKLMTMAQAAARNGQPVPQWITDQLRSIQYMLNGNLPYQTGLAGTAASPPTSRDGQGLSAAPPLATPPAQPTQTIPPSPPVKVSPLPAPGEPAAAPPPTPPATAKALPHEPGTPPAAPPPLQAVMPKMDFSQLPNEKNPDWLMARSREQGDLGNGEAADKFRNEAQRLYDEYAKDGHAMVNGQVVTVPGWDQVQAWKQRIPENQKYVTEQGDQTLVRNRARQQLNTIAGILEEYETGELTDLKAGAQALARAVGIPMPNTAGMNAAAFQEFMKTAIRNAFADVKDMGGKPLVTEIDNSMRATANPKLQPEANRKILSMLYGQLDQAEKFSRDFGPAVSANPGIQRQQFANDWVNKKENDITNLANERESQLAVRGGTPENLSDMKEGSSYILEPGTEENYGIQKGALGGKPMKAKFLGIKDGRAQWKKEK